MDIDPTAQDLDVHEVKTLLALKGGERAPVKKIEESTGLDHSAVMRAALRLSQRGLIKIEESEALTIRLTPEGEADSTKGLPERRMLRILAERGECSLDELQKVAQMSPGEVRIALGWLRRKEWAEILREGNRVFLKITEKGKVNLHEESDDEKLLKTVSKWGEAEVRKLPQDLRSEVGTLKRRGLVEVVERVERSLILTDLGKRVLEAGVTPTEEISELTHELLVTGRWKNTKFKRYDLSLGVPPIYPAKIHPHQKVIEEIRDVLIGMGFVEIKSRIVESEFWNFDILFQAQDHPAREVHSNLSLSKPARTKLPSPELVRRVAKAHEKGVAGSTGWGYKFSTEISRKPVLCSQTTVATVRYLTSRPKPPVKIFCIDRVYRHEKIDYKHLAEFYQCEGIVMDRGLTLRNMLGYLRQIVTNLGFEKMRFRPGFFPFTEPSVEADVFNEERREWIEILGAGLFRPELLRPIGIRYPVLAWGIGLSRLVMMRLGLDDIRDIFSNDLEWLASSRYPPTHAPEPLGVE